MLMSKSSKQSTPLISKELEEQLNAAVAPHVESFNYSMTHGLKAAIANLRPSFLLDPETGYELEVSLVDVNIHKPKADYSRKDSNLYPREARQGSQTYAGNMDVSYKIVLRDDSGEIIDTKLVVNSAGKIPVMVGSQFCDLHGKSAQELVDMGEDYLERGGYFIVSGHERLLRMVINTTRNFPLALKRSTFVLGPGYLDKGIFYRSVREDETSHLNTLHYNEHGTFHLRFGTRLFAFPIVIVLKALKNVSDREILSRIMQGSTRQVDNERIELCIEQARKEYQCISQTTAIDIIAKFFTPILKLSKFYTPKQVFDYVFKTFLVPHCKTADEKFDFIIFTVQKLLKYINGDILPDDSDSILSQDAATPGIVYLTTLKYRLLDHMNVFCLVVNKLRQTKRISFTEMENICTMIEKLTTSHPGGAMKHFLSTGNLPNIMFGSDRAELPQTSGWTVIAERINYSRFISHFRAIHRGAAFQDMKTTTVRKAKTENYGFLCPVHTPDGAPCGLLNHLSHKCLILHDKYELQKIVSACFNLGMLPSCTATKQTSLVFLDGVIIGSVNISEMNNFSDQLRILKVKQMHGISNQLEIATYFPRPNGRFVPMIQLCTYLGRFSRPVINIAQRAIEYIGPKEQSFLNLAINLEEAKKRKDVTHVEIEPISMLSFLATLTPFSDFNQSPRNVYQCQMAKQTMGTPTFAQQQRIDGPVYRILTPQRPMVQTRNQSETLPFNEFLSGTNAVVAVLSYTGYDMEDAMIINKSSYERGFGYGFVYKTTVIDLEADNHFKPDRAYFQKPSNSVDHPSVGKDGLINVGSRIQEGDVLAFYYDTVEKSYNDRRYKGETGIIDRVLLDNTKNNRAAIIVRLNRRPRIGDKFSSRHGQKGVLSVLWPQEDMPFSDSGIVPDVIINPHAFPSRMTIGMLIELMAGKAGATHGYTPDASPFQFSEDNRAIDHFGSHLAKAGYQYYGNETMYSGLFGGVFKADIFLGVCYYQRLRHMVSDKYQARSIGPVDSLTHQPVKGRKKGGGVRFGEMERDCLISHGVAFLLRDRLMNCSDADIGVVCKQCGQMISNYFKSNSERSYCENCKTDVYNEVVEVPQVFKYLAAELSSVNIKLKFSVSPIK